MIWAMWLAAALTWGGTAYYIRSFVKRGRSPSLVFYWYALLFISIALTLVLPEVFGVLNRWSRTPNLSRLLANSATVLAALSVQNAVMCSLLADPARARLQWAQTVVAATAVVAMAVLFFTIGALPEAWEFSDYYHLSHVAAYRFVYLGYMGVAALLLTAIWARFAVASVDLRLKAEFTLLTIGGATGFAYLANDAGVVAKALGWHSPTWWANEQYTSLLIGVAVMLMFFGATTPGWLHLIHSLRSHISSLRLRKLWLVARAAVPRVALISVDPSVDPWWKELLDPRGATFKLHRQVVEIRDALLLLRREVDPAWQEGVLAAASSLKLSGSETRAVSDAILLRQAGSGARREGAGGPTASTTAPSLNERGPKAAPFWTEVGQLLVVAKHLRGSEASRAVMIEIEALTGEASRGRAMQTTAG